MPEISNGQRVRHTTWTNDNEEPLTGTVRLYPAEDREARGSAAGEVRWDGYVVAYELDDELAAHLELA